MFARFSRSLKLGFAALVILGGVISVARAGGDERDVWNATNGVCTTPESRVAPRIPICRTTRPSAVSHRPAFTLESRGGRGALVADTLPFETTRGLQVTFTAFAIGGSPGGADGMTVFFADAAYPRPTSPGGALGYAPSSRAPGLAGGYLAVGLDQSGDFSAPAYHNGGPGRVPETIAVRGAATAAFPYLGGVTDASHHPVSLPFDLDVPTFARGTIDAPRIRVVLQINGHLTVAIDRHDGRGFVTHLALDVAGRNGQPPVPSHVYIGMTTPANSASRHEIANVDITAPDATGTFTPSQIPNLVAWYDPSVANGIVQTGGIVSSLADLSGHGNALVQPTTARRPSYVASGIDSRGSVAFNGTTYLTSSNTSFSAMMFNESTVFAVSNQAATAAPASLLWSGAFANNPRWNLSLTGTDAAFDFDNDGIGERSKVITTTGPATWSAGGSVSTKHQFLNKNGNILSSSVTTGSPVTGAFPLAVGTMYAPTTTSAPYTGALGEVLVFDRYLATTETTEIEGYLACKWGLQNRLPANHPYRTVCPQGGTPTPLPTAAPTGNALRDPVQLLSNGGQLTFNVTATQSSSGAPQLSYNGSAIAPTLRVMPGDTLYVNLTNGLPTPPAGAGYLNDTNMHFHGLHVSPNVPADDSIDMLAMPGQVLHYRIIIPKNHPSGLYWYHSHAHGEAERQNLSGMSGALIVDGVSQYVPEVSRIPERILIVRDAQPAGTILPASDRLQVNAMTWAMRHAATGGRAPSGVMSMNADVRGASTAKTHNPFIRIDPTYRRLAPLATDAHCSTTEKAPHALTVNGQTMPSIGIRPGEKQFWRIVNAASDTYLDLAVDNTTMQVVGLDGVPLASVGNATPTVGHYVLPPASRLEVLLRGPASGTTSFVRTLCFDAGSAGAAMPATTLATIDSSSTPTDNVARVDRVSATMKANPRHYRTAAAIRSAAITGPNQTITYSDQNTIDGQAYDPGGAPLFYAQSGTTALWTVVNNSAQVHTFHIHQIHFVVQSVAGGTASDQASVGEVLDNVNVPAASASGPGSVTLKMDFTDPAIIGTFLLHCHILAHEDGGMMAKVRVGTAAPLTLSPSQLSFVSPTAGAEHTTIGGGRAPYSVGGCSGVANAAVSGTVVTVSPVGVGGCALTVADAAGLVASASVTVDPAGSVVTVSPNQLHFTDPAAGAQNATIAGGTAPYTAAGCSGTATASTQGSTLTVAPHVAGQCTVTVTDSANHASTVAISIAAITVGPTGDNLTFHYNNSRQGWDENESVLTTANVSSSAFALQRRLTASTGFPALGKVYAQPLYASNEKVSDGSTHSLVVIATSTDQVYAYDDRTYAVVWHRSFVSPPGVTPENYTDTGCEDINPSIGITGTPVIDRQLDEMFVVVATSESGKDHLRLHGISLKTGLDVAAAVEVSASVALVGGGTASTDPAYNSARSALLEANGSIYVSLASHCDSGHHQTVHGWLLAYSASTLQSTGTAINLTDATSQPYFGSIWMGGFGPAADASGNLYVATGNGARDGVSSFGMSVLKVPGNLDITKATYFSPYREAADSNADQDLGSGGVVLLPDGAVSTFPHLLVQGGKCGLGSGLGGTTGCQKYLLNRDNLGGFRSGDTGALWHADTGGTGDLFGGPAYFEDAAGASHVVFGTGSPLSTYDLNASPISLSVQSSANVGCLECRNSGSQPIVSSNGKASGTAVVWALKNPDGGGGNISLYAFDALNMSRTLYHGIAGTWTMCNGCSYIGAAMQSVLVANGKVYVPTDGSIAVYGLTGR